jgi:hypothetical protein
VETLPDTSLSTGLERILSEISHPILRHAGLYWQSKLRPGRLPSRADIDPIEVPALLPYLYLLDVERNPIRFRFRLIGTKIVEWAGRDATGQHLDSMDYGEHGPALAAEYRTVVESGLPRHDRRHARWPKREHRYYHRMILPLASDGRVVDMLLGVLLVGEPASRVLPRGACVP